MRICMNTGSLTLSLACLAIAHEPTARHLPSPPLGVPDDPYLPETHVTIDSGLSNILVNFFVLDPTSAWKGAWAFAAATTT